jgi:DNA-binding response OmpR family regulator
LEACDGLEALRLARRHQPSLIISDIMMRPIDGLELLRRVRAAWETADVPVVLMSCATRDVSASGAAAFLAKPFDLDVVLAIVREHARPEAPLPLAPPRHRKPTPVQLAPIKPVRMLTTRGTPHLAAAGEA